MTRPTREPNFDRVADVYRWAEYLALGTVLPRTRTQFLTLLSDRRSAFVLGDGDGRFLAALLAANRNLHAHAVDTSARMLKLLRARCSFAAERLHTLRTSALTATPPNGTDLVVTHFFLDCFDQPQVEHFIQQSASYCRPGTLWLVSEFQLPQRSWLRWPARVYIHLLYLAFRILTGLRVKRLPDTHPALVRAGFTRLAYHERLAGLVYTELWRLDRAVE